MACYNRIITEEEIHLYFINSYSDYSEDFDEQYVSKTCENNGNSADYELNTDNVLWYNLVHPSYRN